MTDETIPTISYCYVCGQHIRRQNGGWVHAPYPDGHDAEPIEHHARACQYCQGTHRCRECDGHGSVGTIMCPACDGEGGCACVHPQDRGEWYEET